MEFDPHTGIWEARECRTLGIYWKDIYRNGILFASEVHAVIAEDFVAQPWMYGNCFAPDSLVRRRVLEQEWHDRENYSRGDNSEDKKLQKISVQIADLLQDEETLESIMETIRQSIASIGDRKMRTIQGSGNRITEHREIGKFQHLIIHGNIGAILSISDEPSPLTIEGDDNLIPFLKAEMTGDCLTIGPEPGVSFSSTKRIKVTAQVESLRQVDISGACNLHVDGINHTHRFLADCSGASSLCLTVESDDVVVDSSGTGKISIIGKTNRVNVDASGSANFNGEFLESHQAIVDLSGASKAVVKGGRVSGDISGVSELTLIGNPERVDIDRSGLAKVRIA